MFGAETMALMDRVTHELHPDYVELLTADPAARSAKIETVARGHTFIGESFVSKGFQVAGSSEQTTKVQSYGPR